jgi:DNA-binding transcriptional LysR family regulator
MRRLLHGRARQSSTKPAASSSEKNESADDWSTLPSSSLPAQARHRPCRQMDGSLPRVSRQAQRGLESGEFSTILAMVSAGMGVSAVPAMAVQPFPGCCFIPMTGKRSRRKIGILRLKRHFESRAEGFFLQYLMERCKAIPAPKKAK